jgi:hypothetical protein
VLGVTLLVTYQTILYITRIFGVFILISISIAIVELSFVILETNIILKRTIFVVVVVVDYQSDFECQITNITKNCILKHLLQTKVLT